MTFTSDPSPFPPDRPLPSERLSCLPARDSDRMPSESAVPGLMLRDGDPAQVGFTESMRLSPGRAREVDVVLGFLGGSGPQAYRMDVRAEVSGEVHSIPITTGLVYATEDGGGMGYNPPYTEWTMSPQRVRVQCEELVNPTLDQQPVCR
ncbi:hypothetical protein LV75_003345 [Actinokineospora diospyrosa]|uniref:Lipoprotein n=2 Tax=Actinokineospora diospyrosa TaxID=103728 RepID=A0ABT1IDZ1_9PSEU|nr:hypothetical protein [Actinokineospora diospyrosa]